jgi:hypothetical protein
LPESFVDFVPKTLVIKAEGNGPLNARFAAFGLIPQKIEAKNAVLLGGPRDAYLCIPLFRFRLTVWLAFCGVKTHLLGKFRRIPLVYLSARALNFPLERLDGRQGIEVTLRTSQE